MTMPDNEQENDRWQEWIENNPPASATTANKEEGESESDGNAGKPA